MSIATWCDPICLLYQGTEIMFTWLASQFQRLDDDADEEVVMRYA